jgi:predicted metallopeptidase
MEFKKANDIQKKVEEIVSNLNLSYIDTRKITCFRSTGSCSRAIARIWSFPKIWQQALKIPPNYAIEVITEKFDRLKKEEKIKVLIHEILHIPKTFSGALRPHRTGTFVLNQKVVNRLYREYKKNKND